VSNACPALLIAITLTCAGQSLTTPHPLAWWTQDPLRLDSSGDLVLGAKAHDGQIVTARDYRFEQSVTRLGVLSGHRIVQIITTIHAGPRIVSSGWSTQDAPPSQWKSLLVQTGTNHQYVEIYHLQGGLGLFLPLKPAAIYGTGPDAILATFDPDSGVGGACQDGYWWFDKTGAHDVDFSPLYHAIDAAIPPNSRYPYRCWALDPGKSELQTGVQRRNAECEACGDLGEVSARYRVQHGSAIPVSVSFKPEN